METKNNIGPFTKIDVPREITIEEKKSLVESLREYLANTTKEQQEKDWEKLKQRNEIGPTVEEFLGGGKPIMFPDEVDCYNAEFEHNPYFFGENLEGVTQVSCFQEGWNACYKWLKSIILDVEEK